MNLWSFSSLLYEIFRKQPPDLKKIEDKGLLAVKLGQMLALRFDFLPPETCTVLSELYQNTDRMPPEDFSQLLAAHVNGTWRDHFAEIAADPLASASVGQVHKATLRSGQPVVVKLIKKDFAAGFRQDVRTVTRLFKVLTAVYPRLKKVADPLGLLEMIERDTLAELDLTNEITNQNLLRDICERHRQDVDLRDLAFPQTYPELSNSNVLVSEAIAGTTLETRLEQGDLEYHHLKNLFRLHGFFMFGIGTFHGDLHPGNVILHENRFYFVDCGAIGRVSDKLRCGLFQFMKHLSQNNFPGCAAALRSMSDREISDSRYKVFLPKLLQLYEDFPGKTVSEVSLTEQMMHTIKMGVHHGMSFEKGMFPIIKSLMYIDGMVLRCNPQAILMQDMREFIPQLEDFVCRDISS